MAALEHTLATILEQISRARATGDEQALADLQQRRDAICAMLCALGQH